MNGFIFILFASLAILVAKSCDEDRKNDEFDTKAIEEIIRRSEEPKGTCGKCEYLKPDQEIEEI